MRRGERFRKTKETEVLVKVNLDGGDAKIETPFGFLNHMLELFSFHSGIGLEVVAKGDVEVDPHHTVEDVGITMGEALRQAVEKGPIRRFGFSIVPMDESLSMVAIDICGRPFLEISGDLNGQVGAFSGELVEEFFSGLSRSLGATIHIRLLSGRNLHHKIESIFKAFALSFREAKVPSKRVESTKGSL